MTLIKKLKYYLNDITSVYHSYYITKQIHLFKMSDINNIPQEFICPITLTIMENPVICDDGYTYEREAIIRLPNSISPMTRQPINKLNLIPNRAIKDAIERYKIETLHGLNIQTQTQLTTNPQLILPHTNISTGIVRSSWNDKLYNIQYKTRNPNYNDTRYSTTLIAVLDTSGSMGDSCSIGVGAEDDGFTRLNLLQHSMNTVIEMLEPGDELILIQFNSTSECIFNETINQLNKPRAKSIIDSLVPRGGTYIWNGLRQAYESSFKATNTNVHIMLLTDGQASDTPYDELKRYLSVSRPLEQIEKLKNIKLTTFGFSYDINSKILFDMGEYTGGGFSFIPDASMVGTTFCNYLANILSPDLFVSQIKQIDTSSLTNYEQIVPFETIDDNIKYELIRYHTYLELKNICDKASSGRIIDYGAKAQLEQFGLWIKNLIQINNHPSNYLNLLTNLLKDWESVNENEAQITKAISRADWFKKWGYHYLLSLSLAHMTRQAHNFKDQGVQLYGSNMFNQLKDCAYQIFSTIQPPRPSRRTQVVRTTMSHYVNNDSGCFAPQCKIKLADGSLIPLNKLTGNEFVFQGVGVDGVKIKYIVKTEIEEGKKNMCKIGNLIISEFHPISIFDTTNTDNWVFPINIKTPKEYKMNCMYNIVLESGYWVEIEGVRCVSLGHQLTEFNSSNMILKHDYFGTYKVIKDLEDFSRATCLMPSIPKIIHIFDYEIMRDEQTNLVIGIKPKKYI